MTTPEPIAAGRNWPARAGVRTRLVRGVAGTERLVDVQARLDDPDDPALNADWQTEARIAADWGLLALAGDGDARTVTRTEFGDTWAATFESADPPARDRTRWPLPGPGKFDLCFFPLTTRPSFSVLALTGPAVAAIRQGGWNMDRGFGQPAPNPVTEVEMRSTLDNGTEVSVQSASDRWALPALHLSGPGDHPPIADRLLSALADRAAPWQVRPLDVDGTQREVLMLDMKSAALPPGVVGPGLLAVAYLDGTHITIVSDDPGFELALSTIDVDDLLNRRA